jgi:hydroxymethylpyrimidine/phosphomethylpyrimidine kinase
VPVRELESSCAARLEAARMLLALGAAGVVIKGGHGSENPVRDLVAKADGSYRWLEHPRSKGPGIRGSGCRFASRLAAALALGRTLEEAAEEAGGFVAGEIERAAGRGARG